MRIKAWVSLVAVALLAAGCDGFYDEPPVRAPNARPGYAVAVGPGETAESVARRFNVPFGALVKANDLRPPYTLRPEQVIIIPPPANYHVRDGDTVAGIATNLGVDEVALAEANGLQRPYHMYVGQVLRVPGGYGPHGQEAVAEMPPEITAPLITPRSSISAQPLPPSAPRSGPPVPAPLPTRSPPPSAAAAPQISAAALAPPPQASAQILPPPSHISVTASAPPTAIVPVAPQPAQKSAPPPAKPAVAAASPGSQPSFLRPVAGQVVEGFGSNGAGHVNEGINIAASAGTSVHAADAGSVIYAGNELAAFGNLILIRHDGGWVTAYGHLGSIAVQKGATVSRGQTIGTVGQTGSVTAPQLHFEIRQGSKPVDPAPFLSGSAG